MQKSRLNRGLKIAIGITAAVASFIWAFAGVDRAALTQALRSASVVWMIAGVLSVAVSLSCVVWRWWCLLDRPRHDVTAGAPWAVLVSATLAAQMANIIVPFRIGDGVRLVAASQTLALGPARAASAAVVERLADVVALGLVAAALIVTGVAPAWARAALLSSSWRAAGVAALAVTAAAGLAWFGAQRISVLPSTSSLRWAAVASVAVPASSALTNFLVFRAFDLPVPAAAALLLMVVLQAGTAIVAVPGGLGVSQLLTVKTLAIWQVAPADALAFSLALYVVANVPKLLLLPVAMAAASRSHVGVAGV